MLTTKGCLARCFIELYSDRAHWLDHFHSSTLQVGDATCEVEVARHLEDGGGGGGGVGERERGQCMSRSSPNFSLA